MPTEQPTCAGVRDELLRICPNLATVLPACRFAVNYELAPEDLPLKPQDEVALIGLVCGG